MFLVSVYFKQEADCTIEKHIHCLKKKVKKKRNHFFFFLTFFKTINRLLIRL